MHTDKTHGTLGGSVYDYVHDRTVHSSSKVQRCVKMIFAMRVYTFGNLFQLQTDGCPIGGPISMSIFDIVLSSCEYLFISMD